MPEFFPIGFVRSSLTPENRGYEGGAEIVVEKKYEEALDGVEEFSHLYVIYHLHLAGDKPGLRIHPKHRCDLPLVGVFATHAQYRPNPIALSIVELVERRGNILYVLNLDAFDGTPVLDIKPFINLQIDGIRQPEWVGRMEEKI